MEGKTKNVLITLGSATAGYAVGYYIGKKMGKPLLFATIGGISTGLAAFFMQNKLVSPFAKKTEGKPEEEKSGFLRHCRDALGDYGSFSSNSPCPGRSK